MCSHTCGPGMFPQWQSAANQLGSTRSAADALARVANFACLHSSIRFHFGQPFWFVFVLFLQPSLHFAQ